MEEDKKNQDTKTTHTIKLAAVAFLCFVVIMFVLCIGIWVGQQRAEFSFQWAENYHRNFGGPSMGMFGNFPARDFMNSHGIFGSIMEIDGDDLTIKSQDNIERTVVVVPQTTIRNNTKTIKLSDININDTVVIIGAPDSQGRIQAVFIRVLPPGLPLSMYLHDTNI